jgi:hypothetical protein
LTKRRRGSGRGCGSGRGSGRGKYSAESKRNAKLRNVDAEFERLRLHLIDIRTGLGKRCLLRPSIDSSDEVKLEGRKDGRKERSEHGILCSRRHGKAYMCQIVDAKIKV